VLDAIAGEEISFLLFCLVAGVSFSQEYPPETARTPASACGDSITKLLHVLVTEADALYEQKKYRQALDRYNSYAEIHQANAHVNTRRRELQKLYETPACYDGRQLEKIRSFAWKQYQLGNCGKALDFYRRLRLLAPGNEEASSCYEELAEKLRPDTINRQARCEPESLEPSDQSVDSSIAVAHEQLHAITGDSCCRIGIVEKADRLYEAGDYAKALTYYERSLRLVSNNMHVQQRIAAIKSRLTFSVEVLQLSFPQVFPVPVMAQTE
jgi:tetratricopeptide (TPR) repeat protein